MVPQHPGNQTPQQGLTAPQAAQNPYVTSSVALDRYNARITGEDQLKLAQAEQAGAQAGKAQAEAEMLQYGAQQMAGQAIAQQGLQAGPEVSPEQVQAEQLADGIVQGQIGQEQLSAMIQAGELDPRVAEAAMGMAQEFMQRPEQVPAEEYGLGGGL